jgi:arylsulfatase A-like enzyme
MRLAAYFLGVLLFLHCLSVAMAETAVPKVSKPNIVVILADDLGWGSLGCYGGAKLRTPACDRLARAGRRFTNAYAPGSVCSPTRYALMTGRYYWRTKIKDGEVLAGAAPLHIETNRLTLGSLARSQGYRTAAIGKWHLGLGMAETTDWNKPLTPGPLSVGFDYFFGLAANVGNQPAAYVENDLLVGHIPGQIVAIEGKGKKQTTLGISPLCVPDEVMGKLTGKAVAWLEENQNGPFFLYFAPNAVHEPITPAKQFRSSPLGSYGDFIEELDWSVRRILDTLDLLKLTDNTLVIFSSDNGGVVNPQAEAQMAAVKAGLAINSHLRGGKHDIWEGGFREPFIVRWPGKVPTGTVCDDIVSLSDVLATLASILHAPLPPGNAEDSLDVSRSWFGTVSGKPPRDSIVLQAPKGAFYAVRQGPWKLIEYKNPPPVQARSRRAEKKIVAFRKHAPKHDGLFNLVEDPDETKDVSTEHPEIAAQLRTLLNESRQKDTTRPMISQ